MRHSCVECVSVWACLWIRRSSLLGKGISVWLTLVVKRREREESYSWCCVQYSDRFSFLLRLYCIDIWTPSQVCMCLYVYNTSLSLSLTLPLNVYNKYNYLWSICTWYFSYSLCVCVMSTLVSIASDSLFTISHCVVCNSFYLLFIFGLFFLRILLDPALQCWVYATNV